MISEEKRAICDKQLEQYLEHKAEQYMLYLVRQMKDNVSKEREKHEEVLVRADNLERKLAGLEVAVTDLEARKRRIEAELAALSLKTEGRGT